MYGWGTKEGPYHKPVVRSKRKRSKYPYNTRVVRHLQPFLVSEPTGRKRNPEKWKEWCRERTEVPWPLFKHTEVGSRPTQYRKHRLGYVGYLLDLRVSVIILRSSLRFGFVRPRPWVSCRKRWVKNYNCRRGKINYRFLQRVLKFEKVTFLNNVSYTKPLNGIKYNNICLKFKMYTLKRGRTSHKSSVAKVLTKQWYEIVKCKGQT